MLDRARYLVRFDDICPTMDWAIWAKVEQLLSEFDIKPILAVVPDNKDPKLVIDEPRPDFWEKARSWREKGWCIALHGYQHLYETKDGGLVAISSQSEFAGLPCDVQRTKLRAAATIFRENQIPVDTWVAPSHSFDIETVRALRDEGLKIISDGYYCRPVEALGMVWVTATVMAFSTGARPDSGRCVITPTASVNAILSGSPKIFVSTARKSSS